MKIRSLSIMIENPNELSVIREILDYVERTENKIPGQIINNILQIRIDELQSMVWACQNGFGQYYENTPPWVVDVWTDLRNIAMVNELFDKMATSDIFIMDKE